MHIPLLVSGHFIPFLTNQHYQTEAGRKIGWSPFMYWESVLWSYMQTGNKTNMDRHIKMYPQKNSRLQQCFRCMMIRNTDLSPQKKKTNKQTPQQTNQFLFLINPYKIINMMEINVCTSKQEVVGSNPPESPVKFFFHRHSESTEYTVLYTRRCRANIQSKINSCIYVAHENNHHGSSTMFYSITILEYEIYGILGSSIRDSNKYFKYPSKCTFQLMRCKVTTSFWNILQLNTRPFFTTSIKKVLIMIM